MIDNVTFGGFVRTLRKEKQMTQLELAKILNLSDKTISKWEQGKAFPDIAVWEALAEALDVTVAELFAGEKVPKEEGKVSAAVFEDGIAVAANEVRQKKKRYRGLLMIMAAGTVVGMVAAIGVVTGDITIIIPGIIRVGVAEVTTGAITVIPIVGLTETATGIRRVLPVVHIPQEMPPVAQVQAERALPVVPMLRLQAGL